MNTVKNKCERKNMCHDEPCGENAKCIPRGTDNFECKCRWGYEGDGFNCVEKNECLEAPCDDNAVCKNTPGRYQCTCKDEYSGLENKDNASMS